MEHFNYPHRDQHRGFPLYALLGLLALILAVGRPALAQATRIIFLHHSCGENLINQGSVREGLTALGYEFYDHGYNGDGLRLADGSYTGTHFDVPDDNTDPDGFAAIFAQPLHDPPDNTFSHLMQYDVIAFKSCYPVSNIGDDYQLNEFKSYYLSIRDTMDQYPAKPFVIVTQPPQVPANSDPAEGARARAFADWLQSDEYLAGHPNVFVFDFFGLLAGDDNFLRSEYREDEYDGHPNERANREIGPLFVTFIDQAVQSYGAAEPRPTPAATPQPEEEAAQPPEEVTEPPPPAESGSPKPADVVDDFESAAGYWGTNAETGSTVECGPAAGTAHSGSSALRLRYAVEPGGWVECGHSFDSVQDWSAASGLSLWIHPDEAGGWVTLMLFSGDPEAASPFELEFEITAEGWTQFVFPWGDLALAEWADEGSLAEIDPARMIGYGFSVGAGEDRNEGTLWVDDVGPATGAEQPQPGPAPTSTPAPAAAVEEPEEETEEESGGGICPGAALALPLGGLGILLAGRRRR
jgi:hypothetical protein